MINDKNEHDGLKMLKEKSVQHVWVVQLSTAVLLSAVQTW